MIARPGALRIDEAGTCPADHWLTAKVRYPWITTDPAEAWEILDARGLLPPEGARGFRAEMPVRASFGDGPEGDAVVYTMHARPATIPDLVAWASLGASAIVTAVLGAEELCAKVAGELAALCVPVDPCERVVWRVAREPLSPSAFAGRFTRAGRGTAQRAFVKSFDLGADGGLWEVGAPGPAGLFAAVSAARELWGMGLALERVGAECAVAVPAVGA